MSRCGCRKRVFQVIDPGLKGLQASRLRFWYIPLRRFLLLVKGRNSLKQLRIWFVFLLVFGPHLLVFRDYLWLYAQRALPVGIRGPYMELNPGSPHTRQMSCYSSSLAPQQFCFCHGSSWPHSLPYPSLRITSLGTWSLISSWVRSLSPTSAALSSLIITGKSQLCPRCPAQVRPPEHPLCPVQNSVGGQDFAAEIFWFMH